MFNYFFRNCLDKYDQALSIIDTDEMWDYYLTTILQLTSDTDKTEVYKRNLLRQSMFNAHQKNKLKPNHYIEWVKDIFFCYNITYCYFLVF